jgi:hypothetical protein
MNTIFGKIITGVLIAALSLAGFPLINAYAVGPNDPPTPQAVPNPIRVNTRLERVFARQTRIVERVGKLYDGSDQGLAKTQNLIDKAKERGLDVSQLQAALDAFKKALPNGRPFYDQAKSLLDSHNGFGANGKVTDSESAKKTIKDIHEALSQFKDAMGGAGKSLREAVKAFRAAHPRPTPTPTTSG